MTLDDDPSAYDISVVVPTYNRSRLLGRTLDSLVAQRTDSLRYEILVVDNCSTDDTREVAKSFARRFPALRYLFEPRQGVSHARNTGIAAARAPIVALIDDDVEADRSWINEILRVFAAQPDIDCVGGRILGRYDEEPPPAWLTPLHWGPVALQAEKGVTRHIDANHASACLMTANFAARRAAFEDVGGFSPEFFRDEDREIQLRLWAAGKRGLYVPEIIVSTRVPRERLTKGYHRRFHIRAGASHARMRYRDRIDRDGRLLREPIHRTTLFGTPGFIYRELLQHAGQWMWSVATLQWNRAFYHETRVLYFGSYVWSRYRQERRTLCVKPPRSRVQDAPRIDTVPAEAMDRELAPCLPSLPPVPLPPPRSGASRRFEAQLRQVR
jgi:glycosyltransferase involved in cell wall biosynthesis